MIQKVKIKRGDFKALAWKENTMQEKLLTILRPHIKSALKLVPRADNAAENASTSSKFGGLPYSEGRCEWPCCPTCRRELTFVVQLEKQQENAIYVFYYCVDCFPWGLDTEEKGQWLVQRFPEPSRDKCQKIDCQESDFEITPCSVSQVQVKMLPDWQGLDSEIPEASDLCCQINKESPWDAYYLAVKELGCIDDYATVIGGYPKFIQSEAGGICQICSSDMAFLAQIDSEDEANLMWGDVGSVYLFQCSEHKSQFHLELQCC